MPRTSVSRVAAGAAIAAALAAGSLSLTAAAASARATPGRVAGVPPAAALECSEPKCLSGTDPATAPWPGRRLAGRTGHGGPSARAAAGMSAPAAAASAHAAAPINCPPPNPEVTTPVSDC